MSQSSGQINRQYRQAYPSPPSFQHHAYHGEQTWPSSADCHQKHPAHSDTSIAPYSPNHNIHIKPCHIFHKHRPQLWSQGVSNYRIAQVHHTLHHQLPWPMEKYVNHLTKWHRGSNLVELVSTMVVPTIFLFFLPQHRTARRLTNGNFIERNDGRYATDWGHYGTTIC
ncbi:hypothetical protein BD410DRAFT_414183 [Rickenella mellea]|uniref:Uncharacterized protein n=1 Tax=Rickenella mellea TaxID=50990 RepID=A0A4Y7QK96_9AGAM|nr:hypothetical protein BD410DRAFT_414183 [Rickenella mellea]